MKAIILAAGYATRLYPLTINKPKALLPVKGIPILNYIIKKIDKIDEIDEIFIVTNDKFYEYFLNWSKNLSKKIKIINDKTSNNETRLGGIGDLNFVIEKEKINDDILVVLGDNLFDFNLKAIIDFFKIINKTLIGVYEVNNLEELKRLGVVEIKNNKITSFEEKPQNPKSTLSSIGIYIYTKSDLNKIKEYMRTDKPKDGPGYLVEYLLTIQDVYAFKLSGLWYDIGSKETYEKVNKEFENELPN